MTTPPPDPDDTVVRLLTTVSRTPRAAEPVLALDRIVGEATGRLAARRAWLRMRIAVVVGVVAGAVLLAWVVVSGLGHGSVLVPALFVGVGVTLVAWWYREALDLHRFGHLRLPLHLAAWSREVTHRGVPLIGHAQELQVLRRRLRVSVGALGRHGVACTLAGRTAAAHNIGVVCRRLEDAHEAASALADALTRGTAAVAHFAESCEGDPAGASVEYGRVPLDVAPAALESRVAGLVDALDSARRVAVGVPFLLTATGRAPSRVADVAAVTEEIPALVRRVERCGPEMVADSRRLLRAADRLHELAARRVLHELAPTAGRRWFSRCAAAVTVTARTRGDRRESRSAFLHAVVSGPTRPGGWRAVVRAGRAAARCDRRELEAVR